MSTITTTVIAVANPSVAMNEIPANTSPRIATTTVPAGDRHRVPGGDHRIPGRLHRRFAGDQFGADRITTNRA